MTGQCYYCAAGEHHECHSHVCTCCGERNREHHRQTDALVAEIRYQIALVNELNESYGYKICGQLFHDADAGEELFCTREAAECDGHHEYIQ